MIEVVVGDIVSVKADAVVRPATTRLEAATEETHLDEAGGPVVRQLLPADRPLGVGAAVVTSAGRLPAEFVIHAVISSPETPATIEGVRRAIVSVLQRANDWQIATLAVPLLGIGGGSLGVEDVTRVLVDTLVSARSATYPSNVCIVVNSEEDKTVVNAHLRTRLAYES